MNSKSSPSFLRKYALLLLVMAFPVLVAAQHNNKPSSPPKSAPAPKPPAQHSNPPTQHTNTQSHTNTNGPSHSGNSNMGHTGTNTGASHTGNTMGGAGHTGTNQPGHGGNTSMGHTGTNGPNNHGAGNTMGHPGGNSNMGHNAGPGGHGPTNHTPPGRQVTLRGGGQAHIRPNGQIRSVNRNGMHIEHGMHGGRTVVSTRNGVRVVSVGRRGGYVQRAYVVRGGRSYYSRTYYYHGAYRAGVYRGYYYGGRPYYGYYPAYYYHPVYYGWAYNPWPAPVYYGWGWGGAPWYGYYGPYYAPYPVYPSAAFWLTDFMIAATLQAAYQAQAEANALLSPLDTDPTLVASLMPLAAPDAKPAMTKEVKDALSEEVKLTLAAEKAEAEKPKSAASSGGSQPAQSNEAPPALDPNFKMFIVSSDMSLTTDGDECALSQGDVIERTTETPDDDGNVNVKVVASNKNDCAIGKEGPVSTDDLQEMYNSFREGLKDGMGELAKKNGQGGLPKAPDTATSDGDVPAPPPDKSAEKALTDQQAAADQTESEVKQEAGSGGGGR
ncbi:MAG TPA: hypothetical protein VMH04_01180 [Candidatus Solibacter sp.]|nr:hypothetical protein [Candidatus Solibacter sp.]